MIETDSQLGDQRTVWMARRDAAFEAMMEHGRAEERAAATAINCAVIECPELGADAPARMLLPDSGGQIQDYPPAAAPPPAPAPRSTTVALLACTWAPSALSVYDRDNRFYPLPWAV